MLLLCFYIVVALGGVPRQFLGLGCCGGLFLFALVVPLGGSLGHSLGLGCCGGFFLFALDLRWVGPLVIPSVLVVVWAYHGAGIISKHKREVGAEPDSLGHIWRAVRQSPVSL